MNTRYCFLLGVACAILVSAAATQHVYHSPGNGSYVDFPVAP